MCHCNIVLHELRYQESASSDWTRLQRWGYVALISPRRLRRDLSRQSKMVAIKMHSCVFSVLVLSVYYSAVSALYFHIGETEKKCFIEEIPDETMIIGE